MTADKRINLEKVKKNLKTSVLGKDLYVFESVTSTFDAAESVEAHHGTVICAKKQTKGTGRMGRSWESDEGGIYCSLILDYANIDFDIQLCTLICALGVQRAISNYTDCRIKWPNDIISSDGKKLCGILTKIKFFGGEPGSVNVGIGINANNKGFSDELKYAGSVRKCIGQEIDESELLCCVLQEIEKILCLDSAELTEEFARVCATLGSRVRIVPSEGEQYVGFAKAIAPDGSLMIEKDDNSLVCVNSGEVSVRGIYGENYV